MNGENIFPIKDIVFLCSQIQVRWFISFVLFFSSLLTCDTISFEGLKSRAANIRGERKELYQEKLIPVFPFLCNLITGGMLCMALLQE